MNPKSVSTIESVWLAFQIVKSGCRCEKVFSFPFISSKISETNRKRSKISDFDSGFPISSSMEDIFDSSLNLEDTHLKEGYAEGYKDGLVSGKEEARQVGLKTGFEVGEELGFYRGCVDVWNMVIRVDPTRFSTRIQKSMKQMEELIDKYPIDDPENELVNEIMEGLRLKFRAISATLGVKLEYDGYPNASEAGKIEF